jgi:hypothetical protein
VADIDLERTQALTARIGATKIDSDPTFQDRYPFNIR